MLDVLFSTLCLFEIDVLVIVEEIEGLGGLKKFPNLIRGRESVYLMTNRNHYYLPQNDLPAFCILVNDVTNCSFAHSETMDFTFDFFL